jgi:signal transduction histidine kinase
VDVDREPSELERELAALRAENARLREEEKSSQQLIRDLGDAIAARDTFIAIAGHELRNPMGAIMVAATSLLHRASNEPVPEWLAPRLAALERQSRSFIRRATTLLDVSRLSTGHVKLEPELVDLSHLVTEVGQGFTHDLELAQSTMTLDVEGAIYGWWDRVALEQVSFNLIQNAIKYGAGKPVKVALTARGGMAKLTVADEGIGIAAVDRERVFARFERAVTQRTQGGFGLGLWIARQLVLASGGTIRVTSEPGAGSIFTVELPQTVEPTPDG